MRSYYVSKAKILANRLIWLHTKKGLHWREIAEFYPGVSFATLNRIAKSKGEWVPKSVHLQELLGIIREPHEKKVLPIIGMGHNWESVFFKPIRKGRKQKGQVVT